MFGRKKQSRGGIDEARVAQIIADFAPAGSGVKLTTQVGANGVVTVFVDTALPAAGHAANQVPSRQQVNGICRAIEGRLKQEVGISSVMAIARQAPAAQGAARALPRGGGAASSAPSRIDGVGKVVAVAAGKGGVGKSTVSLSLGFELVRRGLRVGLLDADFYGPSLPILLPNCPQPEIDDDNLLIPAVHGGLKVMSIGFLLRESSPLVWRGPMLMKTLRQLVREVRYAPLDVLIVDMPPGTGDIALTLAQEVAVDGAVVVATAEAMATADAARCATMFGKFSIPLIGWVENMSWLECPKCAEKIQLFAGDDFEKLTAGSDSPVVARLPFDARTHSHRGDVDQLASFICGDSAYGCEVRLMGERVSASLAVRAEAGVRQQ